MYSSAHSNLKLATLVLAINTALFMSVSAQAASEATIELEKDLGYVPSTTLPTDRKLADATKRSTSLERSTFDFF